MDDYGKKAVTIYSLSNPHHSTIDNNDLYKNNNNNNNSSENNGLISVPHQFDRSIVNQSYFINFIEKNKENKNLYCVPLSVCKGWGAGHVFNSANNRNNPSGCRVFDYFTNGGIIAGELYDRYTSSALIATMIDTISHPYTNTNNKYGNAHELYNNVYV